MALSKVYWIYWGTCFATVITWALAVAAAADDAWLRVYGITTLDFRHNCVDEYSVCARYDAAAAFQFSATGLVSVALVVVVIAAFSSPPQTGVLGVALGILLLYFSVCQMIASSLMVAMVDEFDNSSIKIGPTFLVAVTGSLLGLAGTIIILTLRSCATKNDEGPFRKCMSRGGAVAEGASAGKNVSTCCSSFMAYRIYWNASFATVITWVFAVAAAADDAWLSSNGETGWALGQDCDDNNSVCELHNAATAFQFIATVLVSVALVVVVVAAFVSPPKTGALGLAVGIMLAVFSLFQMVAFSLMAAVVTKLSGWNSDIETGPTFGVAVMASLLGLAGAITILTLRSQATNEDEGPFRKCMSGGGATTRIASAGNNVSTCCSALVAYRVYWSACFATVITWAFAVAAAADDQWIIRFGNIGQQLGQSCNNVDSVCILYEAATAFQFMATVMVSVALVVVVIAAFASPPKTGGFGLLLGIMLAYFSVFQIIAFSLMAAVVTELNDILNNTRSYYYYYYDDDDDFEAGPTLGVAVTGSLLGLAGTITILALRKRATNDVEGPFRKCMPGGGATAGGASAGNNVSTCCSALVAYRVYWSAGFATVIPWAFAVAAATDDAWLTYNGESTGKLGEDCLFNDSVCIRYRFASASQFLATVLVSVALVVVFVASFASPPETSRLGLSVGILLVLFSLCQMMAFSLMAAAITELNDTLSSASYDFETGPTFGVAVTAWLLGLAGGITILALRKRATNDDEGPFRKCMSGGGAMVGGASAGQPVGTV